jgi:drug/metabolite transporter (DMT)-like permease
MSVPTTSKVRTLRSASGIHDFPALVLPDHAGWPGALAKPICGSIMPATSIAGHHPFRGILLVVAATLLFACMDTAGKYMMTKFSVPLVAAVRFSLNLVFLAALMMPSHGRALWTTNRTGLVILRGASLAAASLFAGLALQRLPVGETISIIYLQGFGVMFAASYFLKERITAAGWIAAVIGFAGVVLIARPGGSLAPLGVASALICAAISVVYILLSRVLATTETTMAMLFHVAVVGAALFGVMLAFDWRPYTFTGLDIALLAFMGAASLAGHFLFTSAYRFAPASMLAPFNYFHIAFAVIAGWLVYQHVPDGFALMGMAMIAGSGAAIALHTHFNKTKEP